MDAIAAWVPTAFWAVVFLWSYHREPRQFRNAFFFLFLVITALFTVAVMSQDMWIILPIGLLVVFSPFAFIAFLFANAWVVARREGVSLATLLPLLFGVAVAGWFAALPLSVGFHAPEWVLGAAMLLTAWGAWFFMSFTALLLYSTFYRLLPRKRVYDYIIIHGAGLNGEEPTPLLRGRIETAIRLWDQQGRRAVLVPSGGQGPDEVVSEAEAMHRFLRTNGVGEDSILDEDRSTTTMENLVFAKQLIEERQRGFPYRCAMVTSDYHVFRTATYARAAGIRGDGVGAKTAFYYFPTAFIREFIAFTRKHWWPYAVIAALMLIPVIHRPHRLRARDGAVLGSPLLGGLPARRARFSARGGRRARPGTRARWGTGQRPPGSPQRGRPPGRRRWPRPSPRPAPPARDCGTSA